MALSKPTLATLIKTKMLAKPAGAVDNAALTALCEAIAEAVVEHIQAAGVVAVATTCPAGVGSGTGTVS